MKKLVLLALLLLAPSALGQSVGASQIKKRAAGGLVADPTNALTVAVHRNSVPPSSPVEGQLWCDTTTTPCSLKTYSGSAWTTPPNTAVQVRATLTDLPAGPTDGQIVWISSQARAIVYDATVSKWYYLNEANRFAGADYSIDTTGYPSDVLASPGSTTGTLASGGSMTLGAHSCAVTHYNSTGGETLPGGTYTVTTTSGNQTMALTFASTGIGVAGKRIYCSKAGLTSPLYLVASFDDTTTGTYSVTAADGSFGPQTAPDEDFSAPLPSGWLFSVPDRSYGGCGSTPSGILCSMLKTVTPDSGVQGVRLFYDIAADPTAWRASWAVTRYAKGFAGAGTTAGPNIPLLAIGAGTTPATAYLQQYVTAIDYQSMPFGPTKTPNFYRAYKPVGAAGSYVDRGPYPWPPFTVADATIYVVVAGRREGAERSYRFGVSSNGKDFAYYPAPSGTDGAQRSYTTGMGQGSEFRLVGVALEQPNNATNTLTGLVYKLSNFRWASE